MHPSFRLSFSTKTYGVLVLIILVFGALIAMIDSRASRPQPIQTPPAIRATPTPLPEWWEPKARFGVFCQSQADLRIPGRGIANLIQIAHPPVDRATIMEIVPQLQLMPDGTPITAELLARMRIKVTHCFTSWQEIYDRMEDIFVKMNVISRLENPENPTEADLRQAYLTARYAQTGTPEAVERALQIYPLETTP